MVVNDPLSIVLTLQSWYISNKLFSILNQSGLMVFMLAVVLFQVWFEVAQEGEDEGNKGLLSLNRTEVKLMLAGLVCFFSVLPLFPIKVDMLIYDDNASKNCGVAVTTGSTQSSLNTFNDERVFTPLWWALWHSVSQGLTNAGVSALPCNYDIQRNLLQLSKVDIQSQPLRQEIQDFYEQCFTRARIAMKAAGRKELVTAEDYRKANWLGGEYFMKDNPRAPHTTYTQIQSENAVFNFPFKAERDEPRQKRYRRTETDTVTAYPYCDEWWASEERGRADNQWPGLKWRIFNHVKERNPELASEVMKESGFFARVMGFETTQRERIDMLIQRVLSVENQSSSGRTVRGYGFVLDKTLGHEGREVWNAGAGSFGVVLGHFFTGPALFIVREALPILQTLLICAVVIASPIVLTISSFNIMTLMSLTLTYAGLQFLTFWWELCRSLDSKLIETLYATHSNLNPILGSINSIDDQILKFVLALMYVIIPSVWFGLLGFAGYKVNALGIDTAINKVAQATYQGTQAVISKGSNVAKGN